VAHVLRLYLPSPWESEDLALDKRCMRCSEAEEIDLEILERFLGAIQIMRRDFNGRVLTIHRIGLSIAVGRFDESEAAMSEVLLRLGVTSD